MLLMSRYFEEREKGHSPRVAMDIASLRIGRAIAASGLTVIGGFAALVFSNFPLIESFGEVTVLNMALCLLATLIVLPPLLVWLDEETEWVAVEQRASGRWGQPRRMTTLMPRHLVAPSLRGFQAVFLQ